MAEQEKMGINEFKTFLLGNFATNENVDTISKQFSDAKKELEKALGVDSIPSFYSDAQKYMEVHSISIDSSGKIDISVINQVSKQVETEVKKSQLANEERKAEENIENITKQEDIDEQKKYEDRLLQVKAVDDNIDKYGGIEKFLENATRDEIDQFKNLRKKEGFFDDIDTMLVDIINDSDYEPSLEEKDKISNSKQGKKFKYNSDTNKFEDSVGLKQYIVSLDIFRKRLYDNILGNNGIFNLNELNNMKEDESLSVVFEMKDDEEIQQMINEIQEEYKENQRQNFKQRNSHEQAMPEDVLKTTKGDTIATEEIQENFEIFMQRAMQNVPDYAEEEQSLKDEQSGVEIQTKEGISAEDLLQNLEFGLTDELNDFQIENTDDKQEIQIKDQLQPELVDEEVQNEATEEVQDEKQEEVEDENIEEIEEEIQEEAKEEIPEEQYEAPTFEEEKTGLAGLFSRIANSRAVKAVTNLFTPKAKQDRLGPGQPQKTIKDGFTITTYDAGGNSIESWSNRVKRWAINNGEKIMEGVLSITNLGRKDKENEVLNTPTVVQGISDEQQTPIQEQIQHEQEKAKVNESKGVQPRFADSNQWAVDLNTIESNGTQNISVAELDSQDKSGQEEEKEFGD